MRIKEFVPIIGLNDGRVKFGDESKKIPIVGVIMKGSRIVEGVIQTWTLLDDPNLTETIVKIINFSPHKNQLRYILTKGITMAGFGIIDINKLEEELNIPVMAFLERSIDLENIRQTLEAKFSDGADRWQIIQRIGPPIRVQLNNGKFALVQVSNGFDYDEISDLLKLSQRWGNIPEPLRIAHMIARSYPSDLL